MQLTNGGFVGALVVVAVAAFVAIVWFWPKAAGSGPKPVLGRIGMLLGGQLAITLAILAGVNAYFLFYVSSDDLLGTGKQRSAPADVRLPGLAAAERPMQRKVSSLNSAAGLGDPKVDGQLEEVTIPALRTGLSDTAYVYLPPQYFQPQFATRRFPVVLMLTGYPGNAELFIKRLDVPKMASQEIRAGRAQPAIYVIMRSTPRPPRDTSCTDVPGGPQVETLFAKDVPEAVGVTYRVATDRRGWGVIGHSTGGYCAAKLAMKHSDRFLAAATLGGYFKAIKDPSTGDLYGGSQAVRNSNDLIWRLKNLPPPPVSILVATTKEGSKDYPQALSFLAAAKPPTQVGKMFLPEGGHNLKVFTKLMPDILRWMSGQLRPE